MYYVKGPSANADFNILFSIPGPGTHHCRGVRQLPPHLTCVTVSTTNNARRADKACGRQNIHLQIHIRVLEITVSKTLKSFSVLKFYQLNKCVHSNLRANCCIN